MLLVLWIVGLFAQLPLIPFIETDYIVSGTKDTLGQGVLVKESNGLNIKIEVLSYFPQKEQCFDTWFTSTNGRHTLTVHNFSINAYSSENTEIGKTNSYLFWDNGSKDETFSIKNYEVAKSDSHDSSKYVFFRSVFNVDKQREFFIIIKANYSVDNASDSMEQRMSIIKRHRLTWNKLRAH